MQEAVVNKIKSKIAHCKFGEVFFVSSFPQYDVEYVTKLLAAFNSESHPECYSLTIIFM